MSDPAIVVENLCKSYLLGHRVAESGRYNYGALRDTIARGANNFFRKAADVVRGRQVVQGDDVEEFWALRDISFEVEQGEVLGVIGRNGAGKSTLLKILSRITEPTKGRVLLRGRVASLLEVGTGFHPELTGRENVFLNGAILGMTRREIRKKFDEIVAFAEVEKFLDTPVKRYSSGMYVRLAFAVAAHLEQEILVVDEVLAVGDAEFQRKCLGKIQDVSSREGRTVLFVSHNLAAVSDLSTRAILLRAGRLEIDDTAPRVISAYIAAREMQPVYECGVNQDLDKPYIRRAEVITSEANATHQFGKPLEFRFHIRHRKPIPRGCFSFEVINQFRQPIIHAFLYYPDVQFAGSTPETCLICKIPSPRLNVGHFTLRIYLSDPPGGEHYQTLDDVCPFEIVRTDRTVLWGWRPEVCAYHEDWTWSVETVRAEAGPSCLHD